MRVFHPCDMASPAQLNVKQDRLGAKFQAAVYDSLLWRKVPESGARSVKGCLSGTSLFDTQSCQWGVGVGAKYGAQNSFGETAQVA